MTADLSRLLDGVGAVLLDFDGPVCSIFAGFPAPNLASEPVPLEVLRRTGATGGHGLTRAVEDALWAAERRAVETAEPYAVRPGGDRGDMAGRDAGGGAQQQICRSSECVPDGAPACRARLAGDGRAHADPDRMKPNPEPILQAVRAVGEPPSRCVLVDDSLSDIDGTRAAGVRVIGYANRPAKVELLWVAGADVVIMSMSEIASVLIERIRS
jgi:hypothetical protein